MRTLRLSSVTHSAALRWFFVLTLALVAPLASTHVARVQDASPSGGTSNGLWTTVGGNAARTSEADGPGPARNPSVVWHFTSGFPEYEQLIPSLVVADGLVFMGGGYEQPMIALDQMTGEIRWTADVGIALSANDSAGYFTGTADRGTIYVAGTEGEARCDCNPPAALYALDTKTGQERWRHSIPDLTNLTVPTIAGDLIILTAQYDQDFVLALDAATGAERWRVPLGPDVGNGPSVAVVEGMVYVASIRFSRGGVLLALDAASGSEHWRTETATYPHLAPVVSDNHIFVVADSVDVSETALTAFDATVGTELWTVRLSESGAATTHLAVTQELAYVDFAEFGDSGMPESRMVALDAVSGTEQWRRDGVLSSVVADGIVYTSAYDPSTGQTGGTVFALDGASGAELWRLDGPHGVQAVAGEMVFAVGLRDVWAIAEWTGSGPPETREVVGPTAQPSGASGGADDGLPETVYPTISLINTDGTGLISIGPGTDPQWSPDGSMVAYEGITGDQSDVWVVGADGSNPHPVVEVPGLDMHPTWSPDGTRIAFVNGNDGILFVVNADGSGLVQLASVGGGDPLMDPSSQRPSWSPDGSKLAFAASNGDGVGISVINADGTGLTQLTAPEVVPSPPAGEAFETTVIALVCTDPGAMANPPGEMIPNGDPALYEAKGCRRADPSELTFSIIGQEHSNTEWSLLAEAETDENGAAHLRGNLLAGEGAIYTAQLGFGEMVGGLYIHPPFASSYLFLYLAPPPMDVVPDNPDDEASEIPEPPILPPIIAVDGMSPMKTIATAPAWSPDGTRIAYSMLVPADDGSISSGGIWLMNPDGSGKVQVTDIVPGETAAAWSADGTQLLFASGWTATQVPDVYVVSAGGGSATRITKTSDTPEADPGWSPDGSRIVFSAYGSAGWDIFVASADGSGLVALVRAEQDEFAPAWSPDGSRIAFRSQPPYQGGGD
jgi:Tol biopolymer transport system component/outer membrane protein assembly factor BamB